MTADSSEGDEAFQVLETEIAAMADEPSGAGLDLPDEAVEQRLDVVRPRTRLGVALEAEGGRHDAVSGGVQVGRQQRRGGRRLQRRGRNQGHLPDELHLLLGAGMQR